jgi:hypothetical protein
MVKEVMVRLDDNVGINERRAAEAATDEDIDVTIEVIVIEAEGLMGSSGGLDDIIEVIRKRSGDPLAAAL